MFLYSSKESLVIVKIFDFEILGFPWSWELLDWLFFYFPTTIKKNPFRQCPKAEVDFFCHNIHSLNIRPPPLPPLPTQGWNGQLRLFILKTYTRYNDNGNAIFPYINAYGGFIGAWSATLKWPPTKIYGLYEKTFVRKVVPNDV